MEKYEGAVSSRFKLVKDAVVRILSDTGNVITFGYGSVSMGLSRGFKQDGILLMNHGGSIHDSIGVSERRFMVETASTG